MRIAITRIRALCAIPLVVTALTVGSACSEPSTGPVPTPSSAVSSPHPHRPRRRRRRPAPRRTRRPRQLAARCSPWSTSTTRSMRRLLSNPQRSARPVLQVAGGKYVHVLLQNAQSQRAQGYRVIGAFDSAVARSLRT